MLQSLNMLCHSVPLRDRNRSLLISILYGIVQEIDGPDFRMLDLGAAYS